jgi:hypothetical protein
LAVDIAGALMAPFIGDLIGFALTLLNSILSMPLAWMQGDRIWAYNNEGWAFCQAMYDMSMPFRNPNLANTPPEQWPQLRAPLEPVYPEGNTIGDQIARRGLREGFELAQRTVHDLERSPRVVHFQLQGQPAQLAITGRRLLFLLNVIAHARGERVLDYLRHLVEARAHQNMDVMRW